MRETVLGTALFAANFGASENGTSLGVGFLGVSLAFGLTLMAGIYTWGPISGGHFNPAVTFGLAAAGRFAWKDVPGYLIAQVIGGAVGTTLIVLIGLFGPDGWLSAAQDGGFARIGLIPAAGGTWTLPRTMGMAKALGAALFADKITARQADDWGMIWEAVPDSDFEATWKARAAHLAGGPTQAYRLAKEAIRASWDNDFESQLTLEGKSQGACGQSRDFQEGVVAFMEKRPARFEGR